MAALPPQESAPARRDCTLEIRLHQPDSHYARGEPIRGVVRVTTTASLVCRALELTDGHADAPVRRSTGEDRRRRIQLFGGTWSADEEHEYPFAFDPPDPPKRNTDARRSLIAVASFRRGPKSQATTHYRVTPHGGPQKARFLTAGSGAPEMGDHSEWLEAGLGLVGVLFVLALGVNLMMEAPLTPLLLGGAVGLVTLGTLAMRSIRGRGRIENVQLTTSTSADHAALEVKVAFDAGTRVESVTAKLRGMRQFGTERPHLVDHFTPVQEVNGATPAGARETFFTLPHRPAELRVAQASPELEIRWELRLTFTFDGLPDYVFVQPLALEVPDA